MKPQVLIFSMKLGSHRGFTLVEVIVAVGIVAVTVVSLAVMLAAGSRVAADNSARHQAAQLGDAVAVELMRLRDALAVEGSADPLELLVENIPPSGSTSSLRLVGSRDGLRVVRETDADDPVMGLPSRERFFRVEVRQLGGSLGFRAGAGFLAVAASVQWSGQWEAGPEGPGMVLNLAINP
jgi:hypothetical protein